MELPITGYLDRFSHRPGEEFTVFISVRDSSTYRARLLRVMSGDPNPAGPGMQFEDFSHVFERTLSGRRQAINPGSYGLIERGPNRPANTAVTWTALIYTAAPGDVRAVMSQESHGAQVILAAGAAGAELRLNWPGGSFHLGTQSPLLPRTWYRVWAAIDPPTKTLRVGQQCLDGAPVCVQVIDAAAAKAAPTGGSVMIGAANVARPTLHFTGKIEAPAILPSFTAEWPQALSPPIGAALAAWNFSLGIDTQKIRDIGPYGCHGRLVNLPTRAVVGARWSGREMCWRHAPEDYGAIHFHDDDLDDCRWEPDFTWTVPDDLRSGAYALHLSAEAGEDYLPLYILPRRHGPFAPIAFLASTFTYQAYANHARGNADAAYRARVAEWGAAPHNPDDFPIYGRSTYNRHADRSGIAYSSRLRPILTMRPGFLTFNDARGSGLRHYPADTHLLAWLEAKGIAFDIITDEDLDDDGPALLSPYAAVLTGSHPEYHTPHTLDALQHYTRNAGGRLIYLGGNGFYWRIARDPARPGVIELRRAEGGIRAWDAEPGEYYHATDGAYGGLWRRNRRPPQMLVGVGFSGQGLFEGTYYRRRPASYDAAFAWMFEGIGEDVIGDYGLSGGGAAGFELDRADPALGTPEGAVILAGSEHPPASFVTVPEELLSHIATVSGEPVDELMRGEIVYFETPSGGAVFSVGSITFCGSLWRDGFTGPISRLLENVVRRFAIPRQPGEHGR